MKKTISKELKEIASRGLLICSYCGEKLELVEDVRVGMKHPDEKDTFVLCCKKQECITRHGRRHGI